MHTVHSPLLLLYLPLITRDLKLDNLLLTSHNPPIVKLCDFGFSKYWSEDDSMACRLQSLQVGTADYMSPELIKCRWVTLKAGRCGMGVNM